MPWLPGRRKCRSVFETFPIEILQNWVISAKSPLLLPTFLNQRDPVLELVLLPWLPENRKFRSVFETFHQIQKLIFRKIRKETNRKKRGPETFFFSCFFFISGQFGTCLNHEANILQGQSLGMAPVAGTRFIKAPVAVIFNTHHKRELTCRWGHSWQRIPGV